MNMRGKRALIAALLVAAIAAAAGAVWWATRPAPTDPAVVHAADYDRHLIESGVNVGSKSQYLGRAACTELRNGVPPQTVDSDLVKQHLLDMFKAERIVHWAQQDLCP